MAGSSAYTPHHMSPARGGPSPARRPRPGAVPTGAVEHLQRRRSGAGRVHRQGRDHRDLRSSTDSCNPTWTSFSSTSGCPVHARRSSVGCPARRAGSCRWNLQVAHAIAPDCPQGGGQCATHCRRAAVDTARSARCWRHRPPIPVRYWSFSDRVGLRQADHRGRPGPRCVTALRTRSRTAPPRSTPAVTSPEWNAVADRTGRHRRASRTSAWTRIASLPEMTSVGGTTLSPPTTQGGWISEQTWFDVPLPPGLRWRRLEPVRPATVAGRRVAENCSRPNAITGKRLTPDVAAGPTRSPGSGSC